MTTFPLHQPPTPLELKSGGNSDSDESALIDAFAEADSLPSSDSDALLRNLTVAITAAARAKARDSLQPHEGLQINITGGGCAGFSVRFGKVDLASVAHDNQYVIVFPSTAPYKSSDDSNQSDQEGEENSSLALVLQREALSIMDGATVDYIRSVAGSYFELRSPAAPATCGCGESIGWR